MNLIKPEFLKKGDTIGILSTSGAVEEYENIYRAKTFFENLGYNVIISDNTFDKVRYLSGSDEKKIQELHRFFSDSTIKAIVCSRGGYGAIRLVDKIDYELVRRCPKIFCGYSDVTALNLMLYKKAGLVTFSGPMALNDFGAENPDSYTIESFFKSVTSNELTFDVDYSGESASGVLWGGNLATVVSLCGQDFLPDEDFIFFAEDLNESVYKIDKMFTQLFNIEKFRCHIRALVVGEFLDVDNQLWLDELLMEISEKYNLPLAKGLKATHSIKKDTFPIGAIAQLNKGCLYCSLK